MDRNRKKQKKQPAKKKQAGNGETANWEARLEEEEERLVRLTMELSLKDSLNNPSPSDDIFESSLDTTERKFVSECRAALFEFDPHLQDLIDPSTDDISSNTSATSLPHQYLQQHNATGAREKQFKEKLNLALLFASILGYPRIVKYLLDRGASLHAKTLNGWSPMHWAAAQGQVAVLRVMLAALSSTNLLHDFKDKAEMTPLDILAQELEQTPVKIPLELLNLFGRWRNAASSSTTTATTPNSFYFQENDDEDSDGTELYNEDALASDDDDEDEEEGEPQFDDSGRPQSRLFAWGTGNMHLQGHGDMSSRANPKRVAALEREDIVCLTTSQFSSGAVTADGKVFVWGIGEGMRLGMPMSNHTQEPTPKLIPATLLGDQPAVSISMSNYHGAILTADGSVFTFGRGREGQLGLGQSLCDATTLNDPALPPTLSYLNKGVLSNSGNPSSSSSSSTSLSSSSSSRDAPGSSARNASSPFGSAVATSGSSSDNQLSAVLKPGGNEMAHLLTRVKLPRVKLGDTSTRVAVIACSDSHTALLMESGQCWTFGNGSKGQLGHDLLRGEHSPRQVRNLPDIRFKHLSVGPTHTVLASNSDVWIFGFGNANPRRQKFGFGTPAMAVKMGLLPSFNISSLASGSLHYLVLTKEGDLFSWMHGIDKYPVPVNIDIRQLEKQRQQFEASMAHSGFSVHSGSSASTNLSLSGNASLDQRSGLDRERHHIVKIACVGVTNYVTTSDGLIFTFSNSNRRGNPFTRLNIQPRVRLFAPGRSHFLASIDTPLAPRESWRPEVPLRLLPTHLENVHNANNYTDVLFDCKGETRKGHKFILSISPFLNNLFSSAPAPDASTPTEVKLAEDITLIALDLMLSFLYFGQFVIPEHYKTLDRKKVLSIKTEDKDALLKLAAQWGITELLSLLETGKGVVSEHTRIMADEADLAGIEEAEITQTKSYWPWLRKMQAHLSTQVANSKFADGVLLVEQEESGKSGSPHQTRATKADEIPIHKALLIERSEWFRMTLSMNSNWTESRSAQVSMPHLRSESARLILSYLYTDTLPNKQETSLENLQRLTDLVATSDELLMPELKLIVARRLSRSLTPENVAAILDVAETYQSQQLYECILKFIGSNVELFLRLGSLFELTNHQMALVQQIVLDGRGIQPWRYFKTETEDKLAKLAATFHAIEPLKASSPSAILASDVSLDTSTAAPASFLSPETSQATPTQETSAETVQKPNKSVYVPPGKRRAVQEEEVSTSPKKTFADIQREQEEMEAKAAAAKKPVAPRGIFAWGPPQTASSAAAAPTVNRTLISTDSTTSWPSLSSGKPQEAFVPSEPETSAAPPAAVVAPAPVAAPKKQKVLPSPLRDPKTLSPLKDAVYNPNNASSPSPSPADPKSAASTNAAAAKSSVASTSSAPVVAAGHAKTSAAAAASAAKPKMSAAAAEYKPSFAAPQQANPSVSTANVEKAAAAEKTPASGAKKGGANNQRRNQPKKTNELAGGMKPAKDTKPRNNRQGHGGHGAHGEQGQGQQRPRGGSGHDNLQQQHQQVYDDDLALALALSAQEHETKLAEASSAAGSDKDLVSIQKEEIAAQQHRQRSILEIQAEERQMEEHRMVEAYYASQKLKDEQSRANVAKATTSSSSSALQGGNIRQTRKR